MMMHDHTVVAMRGSRGGRSSCDALLEEGSGATTTWCWARALGGALLSTRPPPPPLLLVARACHVGRPLRSWLVGGS